MCPRTTNMGLTFPYNLFSFRAKQSIRGKPPQIEYKKFVITSAKGEVAVIW